MSLTKDVFDTLICSAADDEEHILDDPMLLPCGIIFNNFLKNSQFDGKTHY